MASWTSERIVLQLLALSVAVFGFLPPREKLCSDSQQCIAVRECPAYQTRAALLRSRPTPCAFHGLSPLVCCDVDTPTPPPPPVTPPPTEPGTEAPVLLRLGLPPPGQCGKRRTFFRRRRAAPVPDLSLSYLPPVAQEGSGSSQETAPLPQELPFSSFEIPSLSVPPLGSHELPSFPISPPESHELPDLPMSPPGSHEPPALPIPPPGSYGPPSSPNFTPDSPPGSREPFEPFGRPEPMVHHAVGGYNAGTEKWPWIVSFGWWLEDGLDAWFCGGTLITQQHVLTAAHCLRQEQASAVGVRIGDVHLDDPYDVFVFERNISRVVRHPEYRGQQNDLAVVTLSEPVPAIEDLGPICLPPAGTEHTGEDVEMAGWGLLEFGGETSAILQEVPLRVADPAACEAAYRRIPHFRSSFPGGFQGTKVCAESRDGELRDACKGDSGGPLMVRLEDGTYQLVGVVAVGFGCGNPDYPGIYTKVSAYIDWITEQLTGTAMTPNAAF